MPFRKAACTLFALVLGASAWASTSIPDNRQRVDAALTRLGFPDGSAVASVSIQDGALNVDFTPPTAQGITDGALEDLSEAVRTAFEDAGSISAVSLTSGGRYLSSYLPPLPQITQEPSPGPKVVASGALTGKRIILSPGHGWTYYGSGSAHATNPTWQLQRSYWQGIVEDFLNQEMIQYVYNLLVNNGATVYTTRDMDKTSGNCSEVFTFGQTRPAVPNLPWWQMGALYYAKRVGAPSSVYDNGLSNDYDRDIRVRGLYANWRGADIMVSLHNNGDSGTASGTLTLYDTQNGYTQTDPANQYGSLYLATKVQNHVVSLLRANYNSSWVDQGLLASAGGYGENRTPQMPACLIETAFMDKTTPDNAALHDEKYKMLVAKGIYEGICDYFHVTPTYKTNISGTSGSWTPESWAKSWSVKLNGAVNAAPSSASGWVYAGTDAGTVYGIAATAASGLTPGTVQWSYTSSTYLGAAVKARPTVYLDKVYAVAVNGRIVALDRLTGARRWYNTVPNSGNLVSAPSVTPDGQVIIGSDNGYLYAYNAVTGALLHRSAASFGPINAQVAIPDGGHVWVSSGDGKIRCLTGSLDTVLWQIATGAALRSSPFVLTANNAVYFVNAAKTVFGLNASNGSPAGTWSASGTVYPVNIGTSPWASAADGTVTFALDNHTISAADTATGAIPAGYPVKPFGVKDFTSSPVVLNGTVYVGGTDGKLYALKRTTAAADPGTGWRVFDTSAEPRPGQFTAAPCLTGTDPASDFVVAGNTNSYLYALPL